MSCEATCNVWASSKAEGNELLVMLAIAECVGDEHGHCTVNVEFLGRMCRLHPGEIGRILKKLVRLGELEPPCPEENIKNKRTENEYWRMTCIPSPLYAREALT